MESEHLTPTDAAPFVIFENYKNHKPTYKTMKPTLVVFSVSFSFFMACSGNQHGGDKNGYAAMNALSMYFEIFGNDRQF